MQQLSLFPEQRPRPRHYVRDRNGKFATKQQRDLIQSTRLTAHYQLLYEAEHRKLLPILRRLIQVERELNELRMKIQKL